MNYVKDIQRVEAAVRHRYNTGDFALTQKAYLSQFFGIDVENRAEIDQVLRVFLERHKRTHSNAYLILNGKKPDWETSDAAPEDAPKKPRRPNGREDRKRRGRGTAFEPHVYSHMRSIRREGK